MPDAPPDVPAVPVVLLSVPHVLGADDGGVEVGGQHRGAASGATDLIGKEKQK